MRQIKNPPRSKNEPAGSVQMQKYRSLAPVFSVIGLIQMYLLISIESTGTSVNLTVILCLPP